MARPPRYDQDQLLDAAAALVVGDGGGPAALTMSGLAGRVGAPSGSVYYRFRSREVLAASLWMRSVERFQAAILPVLERGDPWDAITGSAQALLDWTRVNPTDARLLLLYRSSDLVDGEWPDELVDRNRAQLRRLANAMESLFDRCGADTDPARRRVRFAVTDIPAAAVRPALTAGRPPEPDIDLIVADAVAAVLAPLLPGRTPTAHETETP